LKFKLPRKITILRCPGRKVLSYFFV